MRISVNVCCILTNLWIQTCSSLWCLCSLVPHDLQSWTSFCLYCTTSSLGGPWSGPLWPETKRRDRYASKLIYDWTIFLKLCTSFCMYLDTWKAKSWYFCFSLGPRAYHHSPRILLTVLLSWFGWRWWTNARWRLLKIINAFIGRLMWSFSLWKSEQEKQSDITWHILIKDTLRIVFLWMQWIKKKKTNTTFPGLLLSPSLGSALSDWVRLFPGDVERGCSCTTPGRKLKETEKYLWVYNL